VEKMGGEFNVWTEFVFFYKDIINNDYEDECDDFQKMKQCSVADTKTVRSLES
jgi:hypothetical protein